MATVGTLKRLSASSLSALLLAEQAAAAGDPAIAVIDVRDDDHIGGHIKGSKHVPSGSLDTLLPTLVRQLQDKQTVVFHCALSQQRGPGAALKYVRAREKMLPTLEKQEDGKEQQVFVLDKGFVGWQEVYGTDERLTEGYRKELWADGYWM
ncbi:Rhodanese-like domain-containing protein [Schizothecium vesticola]|uniref:Rhodanese-like domain-containing protein n=1 Tax=Schizothecium vesticola TaxID=314040 RepID=A0AA40ER90_9PEZI|nr:Rhodanese-like domain-containing protein [Schizothecium vesticola]